MKCVVTFGEIMTRFRTPGFRRIRQTMPGSLEVSFAGAEANVAASIALFGGKSSFVTVLPRNPLADACTAFLEGAGIDTTHVIRSDEGRLGTYYIETGANQRPSTVVYDRDHSCIASYPAEKYDWFKIFENADWFHTTGITLSLSEASAKAAIMAARKAKTLGLTVSCDLNFRSKLWRWGKGSFGKDLARKVMSELLPYVDVLIGNESDAEDTLGIKAGNSQAHTGNLEIARYKDVAEQIIVLHPNIRLVAITLRESISASFNKWGAMLYSRDEESVFFAPLDIDGKYKPHDIMAIVDRVGTGDSFGGALIFALRDTVLSQDHKYALNWAVAASTLCHSIDGDFNFVSRKEIEDLVGGDVSGRVRR